MWFLAGSMLTLVLGCVCNELSVTVTKMDEDIVKAITNPVPSIGQSVRKNILRLEIALGEIGERMKDGDQAGLDAVESIISKGGLQLSKVDYINDTLLRNTFGWGKDKCEELKYNLQQICSIWLTMEGGTKPTTMVYIAGRNRSVGLQYMEKYI